MTARARAAAWLVSALWLAPPTAVAADPPAAPSDPVLTIAVARFEAVAQPGRSLPDVATLLADRIGTRGVHKVVGPAQLGVAALAEPEASVARAWAEQAGVAALVVGRTTRIGDRLSVDVHLRSGASGKVERTFVAEALRTQLERAVDRLAEQIVVETRKLVGLPPPAAAAATSLSAETEAKNGSPAPGRAASTGARVAPALGLRPLKLDAPLEIHSEELEAFSDNGARRLVFSKRVVVTQADLTIKADRLEAFYPRNASKPDRLVAKGGVVVRQGRREARCDDATYERSEQRLVCRGHAELREGEDRVRGKVIEFDIAADRVYVKGGASVLIRPESDAENAENAENGGGGA
ncbi:MAG: LptA/OstA family protein [Myxococcota bacterium]